MKVCGPARIQTLRGRLLGREVALVCCGESHEDALDLTRQGGVIEAQRAWLPLPDLAPGSPGFDPEDAIAEKKGVTLSSAKKWAEKVIDGEDSDDEGEALVCLVFEGEAKAKGRAWLFPWQAKRIPEFPFPVNSLVFDWADLDVEAREYNQRRLRREVVPLVKYDELIASRKGQRRAEGIELFDDWLLRHAAGGPHVAVLLEGPVSASEVELHVEASVPPAPAAHACLQGMELDSDESSAEENDPDDGTGSYLAYLSRRLRAELPAQQVRGFDPRELGDADDAVQAEVWQELLPEPLPRDVEDEQLEAAGAASVPGDDDSRSKQPRDGEQVPQAVPSWEAYFGAAAELMYYSPQVKADYAPFLKRCVKSPETLRRFFDALYFRTVPDALQLLDLGEDARPLSRVRSLAYRPSEGAALLRRPGDQGLLPVKAAPLDRYLKSRGSAPPRTWVSGLADRLRALGAGDVVEAARAHVRHEVESLLADPKNADEDGDYFVAFLRECHRDIYDDIDHSDPEELRRTKWANSEEHPRSRKHRHNLGEITIPCLEDAFEEISKFEPSRRVSTKRERVLAKMLIDGFQLKVVDLGAILLVADVVSQMAAGERVVVVLYAGDDHTKRVMDFWRRQGFSEKGLPEKGLVGKDPEDWEDDEPRGLELPSYLHDFRKLFPVPP